MQEIKINTREKYKLIYLAGCDLERKKELLYSTNNNKLQKLLKEEIILLESLLQKLKGE